jgi:D-alanyl-D-alanine carboxypeptidase
MKKLILLFFISLSAHAEQGSFALYDYERGEYQVAYNIDEVRPTASITKLFTAITLLRSGAELDEKVKVQGTSKGHFSKGMMVSRKDLMHAMLVSSDNLAAETLAITYPGGFTQFMLDEDDYIRGHGLIHTHMDDATGLSKTNKSTADDLIRFLSMIATNPEIRNMADDKTAEIVIPKGKKYIHIKLHNTNPSIFKFDNILISKTGFTNPAGRCVLMLVEKDHRYYGIIVLGQKNVKTRSEIANGLITTAPLPSKPLQSDDPIRFDMPL